MSPEPAASADFDGWVSARRAELETLMAAELVAADGDPGRLVEAMRYSLLAPGKRLRPLLALAAAEAAAAGNAQAVDDATRLACAAVELVHCYSLIHDDLPAMDDDDLRRGRPSNHKVFGEATAILAGDALLTLAFQWIAEAGTRSKRPADFLRACAALARGAGVAGMVRGQARDLGEPPPTTLEELERLHSEKTAALFAAALSIGAAAGGASDSEAEALGRFGERYGIAFQHADDLDDADHPELAARARARLAQLVRQAQEALAPLGARGDRLRGFAERLGEAAGEAAR